MSIAPMYISTKPVRIVLDTLGFIRRFLVMCFGKNACLRLLRKSAFRMVIIWRIGVGTALCVEVVISRVMLHHIGFVLVCGWTCIVLLVCLHIGLRVLLRAFA